MGLAEHTSKIVSEFDFSDEELNRHVQEFLKQTGTFCDNCQWHCVGAVCLAAALRSMARVDC